jgi:N-acetyl-gamma-glutamyl-phosphate reductase
VADTRVAVLGASGYAGAIAAMLVHRHPYFELAHVTARSEAGQRLDDVHPRTRVPLELEPWDPDAQSDVDAALVCWPHRVAAPAVAALRERGVRVVDLSADFRLRDRGIYEDWYGPHGAPGLFGQGVYGLPELHRDAIAGADLVANPGCYPTAALLALAPLARAGLLGDVVIDAKSGVSGAGREPTQSTHFISADENMTPYKVGRHRHTPEIEQELDGQGARITVTFTPHLIPLAQGELVSCYVTPARDADPDEIADLYDHAYAREPWVELRDGPPGVLEVRDTNYCRISAHSDPRTGRSSCLHRSTTCGRAPPPRPCRTST